MINHDKPINSYRPHRFSSPYNTEGLVSGWKGQSMLEEPPNCQNVQGCFQKFHMVSQSHLCLFRSFVALCSVSTCISDEPRPPRPPDDHRWQNGAGPKFQKNMTTQAWNDKLCWNNMWNVYLTEYDRCRIRKSHSVTCKVWHSWLSDKYDPSFHHLRGAT